MEASLSLAARRYANRDWEGTLEALHDVESTEGNHLDLAYFLGLCHARLDHWDEALLYLEQVVTADSDFMRIYQCRIALAYVYSITERYRLAEYELGRLVEVGFESVQVLSFLGYTAFAQGMPDEAKRRYARALDIDPEYPTALNGLGYVLACEGKDISRALTYCRKAVDKNPDNPAYLDSLAWACFRLGKLSDAKAFIERARELAPAEIEILRHAQSIESGEIES
jgi:tetratricopeptide (TPR) repeat protein